LSYAIRALFVLAILIFPLKELACQAFLKANQKAIFMVSDMSVLKIAIYFLK